MPELVTPESVGINPGQLARVGEHLRQRYVEPGKVPGTIALVARHGKVCYLDVAGQRDVERGSPMTGDTIVRIYAMTKRVRSVALIRAAEKGSAIIPAASGAPAGPARAVAVSSASKLAWPPGECAS